jgi:hypothetical protein
MDKRLRNWDLCDTSIGGEMPTVRAATVFAQKVKKDRLSLAVNRFSKESTVAKGAPPMSKEVKELLIGFGRMHRRELQQRKLDGKIIALQDEMIRDLKCASGIAQEVIKDMRRKHSDLIQENAGLERGFEKLHELWREERIQKQLAQLRLLQQKAQDIRNVRDKENLDLLKKIAASARKTKAGKPIYTEISKDAGRLIPNPRIAGRKLDDKHCKKLLTERRT